MLFPLESVGLFSWKRLPTSFPSFSGFVSLALSINSVVFCRMFAFVFPGTWSSSEGSSRRPPSEVCFRTFAASFCRVLDRFSCRFLRVARPVLIPRPFFFLRSLCRRRCVRSLQRSPRPQHRARQLFGRSPRQEGHERTHCSDACLRVRQSTPIAFFQSA